MKHVAVLACLLSFCLVTACTPVANAPVAPEPTPAPTSTPPADTQSNPFPRLANPQPGETLEVAEYFDDPHNGVKVQQLTVTGGTGNEGGSTLDYQVQAKVDLGDKGVHDVSIVEEHAPADSGLPDVFTVTDQTATRSFVFRVSPDASKLIIGEGEGALEVTLAGDETFSLNGGAPLGVDAVASQALEGSLKDQLTPHALALLYSRLLRTPVDGAQGYRTQSGATPVLMNYPYLLMLLYMILLMWMPTYMPIGMLG